MPVEIGLNSICENQNNLGKRTWLQQLQPHLLRLLQAHQQQQQRQQAWLAQYQQHQPKQEQLELFRKRQQKAQGRARQVPYHLLCCLEGAAAQESAS